MDGNARYLAEEIAENCADGVMSRRQAMRQLGFLGFTAIGAAALLDACGGTNDAGKNTSAQGSTTGPTGAPGTTAAAGPTTTSPPVAPQAITFPGQGHTVQGWYSAAASPKGAVLVIHENRGITDFVKGITGQIAGSGFSALAVDLLSAQGGTAAVPADQVPNQLTTNATDGTNVNDMKSGLSELQRRVPGAKLGATGFCFGGNMTWYLVNAGDPPPLAAAVPFYGQLLNEDLSKTKAAILAIYAELDTRVNAYRDSATAAMQKAKLTNETKTFPGVNHAFMNNTGTAYNATQAAAAYAAMIDWFGRYLK